MRIWFRFCFQIPNQFSIICYFGSTAHNNLWYSQRRDIKPVPSIYLNFGWATFVCRKNADSTHFFYWDSVFNVQRSCIMHNETVEREKKSHRMQATRVTNNVSNPSKRCHSLWFVESPFTVGIFPISLPQFYFLSSAMLVNLWKEKLHLSG